MASYSARYSIIGLLLLLISTGAYAQDTYPKVIKTSPEIGAIDVDPATTALRLEFDQDMAGGMSWTGGGRCVPGARGQTGLGNAAGMCCHRQA